MPSLLDPGARGRVILVGAGPGDPGLLTVRAVEALRSADVVVHDGLIDPRVLDLAPASAHRISVAKQRARHNVPQDATNALIVAPVKVSSIVVRLKGGDPRSEARRVGNECASTGRYRRETYHHKKQH